MKIKKKSIHSVQNRKSIVTKISKANIGIFLLTWLLILVGVLAVNVNYHYRKDTLMMDIYISNTLSSIDNAMKDMGRVSLVCFSDKGIQEILRSNREASYREQLENEKYLQELYTSLITIRDDIKGVYLFDTDSMIFYQDHYNPGIKSDADIETFLDYVIEKESTEGNISGCQFFLGTLPEFIHYNKAYSENPYSYNCLYLVRPIRSFSPFEVIGHIVLQTPIQTVREILDEYLEKDMSYLLVAEDGSIICSEKEGIIGKKLQTEEPGLYDKIEAQKGSFSGSYNNDSCLISYQVSKYSGMTLITAKTLLSIVLEMKNMVIYCCIITLLFAVVSLIWVYLVTKSGLSRVTDFSRELSFFEPTNLDKRYEVMREDEAEIEQLKQSFNYMMDIINNLVVSEYEGKMKLQEAQLMEQKLSMLYLKNQINPHFLYNTLDMIRIKAAINGDKEVSGMLMQLVTFYRLSTRVDSSLVSIDHEVKMLKAYMNLMCCRYPGLIYEEEVDKNLLGIQIPNFILQPLMENSLQHGLRDLGYKGRIQLKIFGMEKKEELKIQVIDDGVGMSEEMLEKMASCTGQESGGQLFSGEERAHIGIANVQSRLRIFYGADCKITFANRPKGGLCATIIIKRVADKGDI